MTQDADHGPADVRWSAARSLLLHFEMQITLTFLDIIAVVIILYDYFQQ